MPDKDGKIKGISVPRVPWLENDDETHFPDPKAELKSWEEANKAAMIAYRLRQAEQEDSRKK
jgi:hypothetical protein